MVIGPSIVFNRLPITALFMVTKQTRPGAVAAPAPDNSFFSSSCAHFMWTLSTIHHQIGTAEGLVYVVSQPNVIITKSTGYNEAA